jgi:hypothetical protein
MMRESFANLGSTKRRAAETCRAAEDFAQRHPRDVSQR